LNDEHPIGYPSISDRRTVPGRRRRLKANINKYVEAAGSPALAGEVVAIITPHAGHVYSGPVAGYAFATLVGLQPEVVAVISPMHYPNSPALITTGHDAYATPLGVVPVDKTALQALDDELNSRLGFRLARVRNDPELFRIGCHSCVRKNDFGPACDGA
jgi:predicted class III extradiol MEMO1 family dioxygenase